MEHSLHHVGSLLGARLAEQGAVRLQAKSINITGPQSVYLEAGRLYFSVPVEWKVTHLGQLLSVQTAHTAAFWELLPQVHLVSNNTHGDFVFRWILYENKKGHWILLPTGAVFSPQGRFVNQLFASYLDLIHPRSDVEEAALWSDIVEEQDSVSFTEVRPRNATKPAVQRNTATSVTIKRTSQVLIFNSVFLLDNKL